ncbi:hypothetical protein EVAR_30919_1 [Eumeta japonica]|uniref:Uncharacterized protein n=1 Tax=Eumeta variegata TaxID=151549 RepID=A0A4C1V468_EUMVA|nr:hypothetical protein EVAR_30919_1 [Eumeta japonica]
MFIVKDEHKQNLVRKVITFPRQTRETSSKARLPEHLRSNIGFDTVVTPFPTAISIRRRVKGDTHSSIFHCLDVRSFRSCAGAGNNNGIDFIHWNKFTRPNNVDVVFENYSRMKMFRIFRLTKALAGGGALNPRKSLYTLHGYADVESKN